MPDDCLNLSLSVEIAILTDYMDLFLPFFFFSFFSLPMSVSQIFVFLFRFCVNFGYNFFQPKNTRTDYYENPIDGRFYCNVCGRNYVRKKHVLRHIRYECVNVPPRFYCANCSKQYRQSNALFHHIRQKHGPLARDTMNFSGFNQRNFKVANDGRVIFNCF